MGFRAIKELKKQSTSERKKIYIPHLIVGGSFGSVLIAESLLEKHPTKFKFINEKEIYERDLFFPSHNDLRGEDNKKVFEKLRSDITIKQSENVPVFYKDSDLKRFDGRSKPHTFLAGEEYFSSENYEFNRKLLLPSEENIKVILDKVEKHFIESIDLITSERLDEPAHYRIYCRDEISIECEHLYWGKSPSLLSKLISNKEKLSNELLELMINSQSAIGLSVILKYGEKVLDHIGTVFLPQSLTHEWGHFICEISPYCDIEKCQKIVLFSFIGEQDQADEELAKKIKLAKRVFERVFDGTSNKKYSEEILVSDAISSSPFEDNLANNIQGQLELLHFVSMQSPINAGFLESQHIDVDLSKINFITRELVSTHQCRVKI